MRRCFQSAHDGGGAVAAGGGGGIWHWPCRFRFRFPMTISGRRMMRTTASFRRLHVAYFLFFSAVGLVAVWQLSFSSSSSSPAPSQSASPSSSASAAGRQVAPMDALYLAVSALTVTGLSPVAIEQLPLPVHVSLLLLMTLGSQVLTSAIPLFIRGAVSTHSISRFSLLVRNYSQHSLLSSSSSSSSSSPASAAAPRLNDGSSAPSQPKNSSSPKPAAVGAAPRAPTDPHPHRQGNEEEEVDVDIDSLLPSTSKTVKRAVSLPAMPTLKWSRHEIDAAQVQAVQLTELSSWQKKGVASAQQQPSAAAASRANEEDGDDPADEAGQQQKAGNSTGAVVRGPPVAGLIEQEALVLLSWTVCTYWLAMQGLGFVVSVACVLGSEGTRQLLKGRGVWPVFFALFATVSAFANAGLSLLDDNLVALQGNAPFLLWMCVLILLGNTLYAPALRVLVWCLYKLEGGNPNAYDDANDHHRGTLTLNHPALVVDVRSKKKLRRRIALRYLLTSPRRCFTHLFPRTETLWLVLTVLVLNATQLIDISILDWHGPVFSSLPSNGLKLVNALFTSVTTRNAGLNVVNIAAFSAPTLVLLAVMMYIAVYPVYLSRERSKEQVGISLTGDSSRTGAGSNERMTSQFRALLARDSLYLFIAMFCICLTERNSIQEDPLNFSIFNILFEIISAYGNVGLSLGYSCALQLASSKDECVDVSYSFSGKWSNIGKLVLVGVMLLGRHRALPDDLDWAISLPSYN